MKGVKMAENNLELWNKYRQPPASVLKPIGAGRLKGKSDINPMWRYQALTEEFGPCGQGWNYDILSLWTEPGANGEVFAFAKVELFTEPAKAGQVMRGIIGVGGSKLIQKEKEGMHNNDEGFKMAVTDALGTACKMLGFAADVYMGLWDGSKYKEPLAQPGGPVSPEPPKATNPPGVEAWTTAQRGKLWAMCKVKGMSETEAKDFIEKYIPNKDKSTASSLIEHFDDVFADYTGVA
jgi:hypothetical protein